jgi:hypothetical protein
VTFCDVFESVNVTIILSQSIPEVSFNNYINVIARRNKVREITNTWWTGKSQNLGILDVVVYIATTGIQRFKLHI